MSPRLGQVTTRRHGGVSLHDYQAPQDGLFVHSIIIEGPTELVLFDAQFMLDYATELADYIETLGKPVERIIISHAHPDHWSGLAVIARRFPRAAIMALASVRDAIIADGQAIMTSRQRIFGNRVADAPVLPTATIEPGTHMFDTVRFDIEALEEGEAQHQMVVMLPDQATMLAFDLVFPASHHVFTVAAYFDGWIALLHDLARRSFDSVLIGHAGPAGRDDIAATIAYLQTARAIHARADSAAHYAEQLKAAFPMRAESGWVDFAALMLYGEIQP